MRWAAALLVSVLLSGCAGGAETPHGQQRSSPRTQGEEEGEQALRKIPAPDRLAFVQLGVAAGNLRSIAAFMKLRNEVRPRDTLTLARLRRNVRSLEPRDRLLRRIRLWTLEELRRALDARRDREAARRSVPTTLAGVERIVSGLRAYVFVHPEIGALVPE
jgi:hypothetical protein